MLTYVLLVAAKTALRRKKIHEHNLEQTLNHIATLEQQMNAIESANIHQETFMAMQRATKAMATIHGKLTPGKVDETMYVHSPISQPARCKLKGY
jgi:charged multivesicular body protein 4